MTEQLITVIQTEQNCRSQLSTLRAHVKEEKTAALLCAEPTSVSAFLSRLQSDDAKTRKNAALLLGDIAAFVQSETLRKTVLEALWQAYQSETTQFVKSAYIRSIAAYPCQSYLKRFGEELEKYQTEDVCEEDRKHIRELRKELEQAINRYQKENTTLKPARLRRKHGILLVAEPYIREKLSEELKKIGETESKETAQGIRVVTDRLDNIQHLLLYREMLFVLRTKAGTVLDKSNLAKGIATSELLPLLRELYGERTAYTFHLSYRGTDDGGSAKERKRLGFEIEEYAEHRLQNVAGNVLADILIHQKKDGTYRLYARFSGIADNRFPYHGKTLPTAMAPVTAAQMIALAMPYLNPQAHVIDPFCGTGTLLIERCRYVPAKDVYGIDHYGEAIAIAKEQTAKAGKEFYYIHRDYFDFTSSHELEEVITEFPRMENKSRAEVYEFYRRFFEKTMEITGSEATLLLLSTDEEAIKKHIRLYREIQLVRQIGMRGQENIFILRKRG